VWAGNKLRRTEILVAVYGMTLLGIMESMIICALVSLDDKR